MNYDNMEVDASQVLAELTAKLTEQETQLAVKNVQIKMLIQECKDKDARIAALSENEV